ncbi:MAG: OsmC family protein [Thermoanaerobaculia bacterium]
MSVSMSGRLTSPTSTELVHGPSGARLETTAPKDNGGDGSRFSPTDLCTASAVSCAATTVSLYATRNGIPLTGIAFEIEKHMTAEPPRRIAKLVARFHVSSPCRDEDFQKLVNVGRACPVFRSLHPDVLVEDVWERV